MLYRKIREIREIRPTADAMSCLAADPDMDQEMANVSLAFMAETFAMQVMQEELDETPVDEELGKLYEIAKYVREEAVGLLGSCFMLQRQLAPDAREMLETEDNGSLTDREVVIMEDLRKAVVDAGFMDPEKERLFAAICDEGKDQLTPVGRRIIDPEDENSDLVFVHLECLESLMQQYRHIRKDQYLVLSVGSKEDEDIEEEDLPVVFEKSFFPEEGVYGSCDGEYCHRIKVGDGCQGDADDPSDEGQPRGWAKAVRRRGQAAGGVQQGSCRGQQKDSDQLLRTERTRDHNSEVGEGRDPGFGPGLFFCDFLWEYWHEGCYFLYGLYGIFALTSAGIWRVFL